MDRTTARLDRMRLNPDASLENQSNGPAHRKSGCSVIGNRDGSMLADKRLTAPQVTGPQCDWRFLEYGPPRYGNKAESKMRNRTRVSIGTSWHRTPWYLSAE